MSSLRVLLSGHDFMVDLLPFCENALRELGADVRVLATSRASVVAPWWERRSIHRFPLGWRIERHYRQKEEALQERNFRRNATEVLAGWQPDLLVSVLSPATEPIASVFPLLGRAKKAGWLMDDPFGPSHDSTAGLEEFDHVYVVDSSWMTNVHLLTGRPVSALMCGADLAHHYPVRRERIPPEYLGGIAFVGSSYPGVPAGELRQVLLRSIRDLDLRIYGSNTWLLDPALAALYRGGPLATERVNLVYNGADMVLNIHHSQFKTGTSLRTFAVCASGALQIVDWRSELAQYLEPDAEVVTFETAAELRSKVIYYGEHRMKRQEIAAAGLARVRNEHTYMHRLAIILRDADLLPREGKKYLPSASV